MVFYVDQPEVYRIGTIIFDEPLSERSIGTLGLKKISGECIVEVYPSEGPIPHFHLYTSNKEFSTAICLLTNKYFGHGDKYEETLTSGQCKQLNRWMSSPHHKHKGFSNWMEAIAEWNRSNPEFRVIASAYEQPDYSEMTKQYLDDKE